MIIKYLKCNKGHWGFTKKDTFLFWTLPIWIVPALVVGTVRYGIDKIKNRKKDK